MTHPIIKFLSILTGTLIGYMILNAIGLGWVAALAVGIAVALFALRLMSRPADGQAEVERGGASEAVQRSRQRQEDAHREADCGLTHEERVRFQNIVENLDGDGTDTP